MYACVKEREREREKEIMGGRDGLSEGRARESARKDGE